MPQETFTRKEVRELLKRQIQASVESYNRAGVNMNLCRGFQASEYMDEIGKTMKRLKKVNIIKF
jgi:hypothetical protein